MNGRIDWMEMIVNALPDYSERIIWSDGETEILVKTESAANTIADLIEALYRAQGEEVLVNTGFYDPEEDERNNEKDRYTGYDKVDTMINDGEIDLPCDGGNYGYKRELEVKEAKKESNISKNITVTKEQLKERLKNGEHLEDIFEFSDGQECLIYKGDFEVSDNIIYIPDIWLNELNVDNKATEEDIEDII